MTRPTPAELLTIYREARALISKPENWITGRMARRAQGQPTSTSAVGLSTAGPAGIILGVVTAFLAFGRCMCGFSILCGVRLTKSENWLLSGSGAVAGLAMTISTWIMARELVGAR